MIPAYLHLAIQPEGASGDYADVDHLVTLPAVADMDEDKVAAILAVVAAAAAAQFAQLATTI